MSIHALTTQAESPPRDRWGLATLWGVTLGLICLHVWLRWPALYNPHFHNEDTAGITYSAELILRGGLPLRDTVEMKAPGSFYLLAGWWALVGRSMMSAQLLMLIWSGLAAVGVGVGAWWLVQDRRAALIAALMYILWAPYTDSVDINYGAWMITPYVWSAALLFKALKRPSGEMRWWLIAGLCMTLAALCKRQGAALAPLFALGALTARQGRGLWWVVRSLLSAALGSLLGFLPIALWYGAQGAFSDWLNSYALSRSGWAYVKGGAGAGLSQAELWLRVGDGLMGLWEFSRAPLCLASCATLALCLRARRADEASPQLRLLWALTALSFLGASLGWRYFKGYYLQLLPGLIWVVSLALKEPPTELFRGRWQRVISTLVALGLLVPMSRDLQQTWAARVRRERPLYLPTYEVHRVSAWINKQAQPGDTLWVWGRWGWPAYHHTGLMSPTRYFKSLGVLTTQLTNTWNPARRSAPVRFNPGSAWPEAIEELREDPPRFIVLARNEDIRGFRALKALLAERYERVPQSALKLHRPKQAVFKVYLRR